MDITFGTIPLIVLTFKGYCLVRNFATDYNFYNKKLRSVLRDITITASIFKAAVDTLLEEVIDEDTREIMLEDLGSEHWKQHDLHTQLEAILGSSFEAWRDSICRTQETLVEVKKLLLVLSGNTIAPSRKQFPFEHLTKTVTSIATSVLKTDPFQLHPKNIQIQSTHKKLLSLAKDHRGELERLRDELRSQNTELLAILKFASDRKSNSQTNRPARRHRIPRPNQEINDLADHMNRACVNSRAMQTASQRLYRMISQTLLCNCHTIHLRLDKESRELSTAKDLKGKSKQPPPIAEPEPHFTFQLTVKSHDENKKSVSKMTKPIHLVFTGCRLNDTDSSPESNPPKLTICEEMISSGERYERHLRDATGSSNLGFSLRRECSKVTAKASSSFLPLSLDDLLETRPSDIRSFDRFLISANLAHSLVHFYSSPWVGDWSIQTIHYFEQQEPTSTLGLWTPHISLKYDRDLCQFGVKNREIHSLGLILLQLGGKRRLQILQGEEEELVLQMALGDLCREMGPKYMQFVRNCLDFWSERSMDLMKDENLNAFLSQVIMLEEQAKFFGSG